MSIINTTVQPFKANAFHNGKFITVTDEQRWTLVGFIRSMLHRGR